MSMAGFTACAAGGRQQLDNSRHSSPLRWDWAVPTLLPPRRLEPLGSGGLRAPAPYVWMAFSRPGTIDGNFLHLNIHCKQNKQHKTWKECLRKPNPPVRNKWCSWAARAAAVAVIQSNNRDTRTRRGCVPFQSQNTLGCCAVLAHFRNPHFTPLLHTDIRRKGAHRSLGYDSARESARPTYSKGLSAVGGSSWLFGTPRIWHCWGPLQAGIVTKGWEKKRDEKRQIQKPGECTDCCVVYCLWRIGEGSGWSWCNLVSEFWLTRELDVICWASGLQWNLPKFHSLLFIWLLIKNRVTLAPPQQRKYAYRC